MQPVPKILYAILLYSAPGRGAKYCDEYVCLYVCLSVCLSARVAQKHFSKLSFVHIAHAVVRSSSEGVVIRRVLPVLWMTSCFHIGALCHVVCIPKQRQNSLPTSITARFQPNFVQKTSRQLRAVDNVCYKLAFHGADTDTDTDIDTDFPARILARKSRVSDVRMYRRVGQVGVGVRVFFRSVY